VVLHTSSFVLGAAWALLHYSVLLGYRPLRALRMLTEATKVGNVKNKR